MLAEYCHFRAKVHKQCKKIGKCKEKKSMYKQKYKDLVSKLKSKKQDKLGKSTNDPLRCNSRTDTSFAWT